MQDQEAKETFQVLTCAVRACDDYPEGNAVLTTDSGNEVQVPVCNDHVSEVCFEIQ